MNLTDYYIPKTVYLCGRLHQPWPCTVLHQVLGEPRPITLCCGMHRTSVCRGCELFGYNLTENCPNRVVVDREKVRPPSFSIRLREVST